MAEAGAGLELAAMLVEELRRGREWAVQLQAGGGGQININNNNNNNDDDEEELILFSYPQLQRLLQKIISSLEKSITLLNSNFNLPTHHHHHHHHQDKDTIAPLPPPPIPNNINNNNSSPLLATASSSTPPPTLEVSYEGDSPKLGGRGVFKKRKTSGSQQVRVCSATGLGGGLDDGHSWRKYGQKDILGANHPRAYYRCTHRYMQGCMAKKHIQRSDADPSIFEVTYKGTHTCTSSSSSSSSISAESRSPNGAQQLLHQLQKQDEKQHGLLLLVNSHGPTETDLDDGNIASGDDIFPTFVSPASSDDDSFMNFSFLFDQNDNDYCFEELTQFTGRSESDSSNNSPFADWHLPAAAAAAADDDDHHQVLNLDAIDIWEYFS
ncbi:unnamed protein product [Cuscuta campestris]|uniref:WRKY domain-containing protein n=1 Tax=Cuscuta campestris TaxID=132261 RepID=A0A484LZN0_9ASTE|nr:unnamed protein product [Cuscuta campestris]